MVSKRLKRIRKRLREKNKKVVPPPGKASGYPQIVTTPTNDMMSALVDRSVYNTNYVSDRKPSRKKLRNMRSKMANEAENPNGGANASAAMMSRLGHLMSNGTQNDMLTQRIQAVQNTMDNKTLEITYKNQLAALQAQERNMVNEEKLEAMREKYEDKLQKRELKIKELKEAKQYKQRFEASQEEIQGLKQQLKDQDNYYQEEKQRREFEQGMAEMRWRAEYNKREEDHQRKLRAKKEEIGELQERVDELKEANHRFEEDQRIKQHENVVKNDLLREVSTLLKNEITEARSPIIELLKETNQQMQDVREMRQLINDQDREIQELTHQKNINTVKEAGAEKINNLQEEVDEQHHNMEMNELNRTHERGVKRVEREKAKLKVEEKIAQQAADMEDFLNPETVRAEIELNEARHAKKLSVELINTHRETNKEIAVAITHFDTLGMTEGLKQVVGLSGDDITKSLTSDQCNGYILEEKVKREEDLRTLQERNATLDSISETADKINAMNQSIQYKANKLSTITYLKPFLEETFGEEYRDKFFDDKYCKIHRDLLEERRHVIEAEADTYASQARSDAIKELRVQNPYMLEQLFQDRYKDTLDAVEMDARARKKAELESALRGEAYTMADREVKAMPVPLLPEYLPQASAYVNRQYKISKKRLEELDALMDKDDEICRNNAGIAEYTRELQQREITSGF